MGAPTGNKNGAKGREWRDAIRLALARYVDKDAGVKRGQALSKIAEEVVKAAVSGDHDAIKEIGDRLDGKPALAITGPDGGPLFDKVERTIRK